MKMRYFYNDPLAASWMAKHFGMQVTRTHCHRGDGKFGESMQPVPIWILARDVENQVSTAVRYYVYPESMEILEPQEGDVIHTDLNGWVSVEQIQSEGRAKEAMYFIRRGGRIIHRDGKAFHFPESEAV